MRKVVAGLVAGLIAHGSGAQAPAAPAGKADARMTAPAVAAASGAGGELECLVEPHVLVNVGSSVDGVLDQVLVNRGDQVLALDLLFTGDNSLAARRVPEYTRRAACGPRAAARC